MQHVEDPTHIAGGTLDLVLTRNCITDHIPVNNFGVEQTTALEQSLIIF